MKYIKKWSFFSMLALIITVLLMVIFEGFMPGITIRVKIIRWPIVGILVNGILGWLIGSLCEINGKFKNH